MPCREKSHHPKNILYKKKMLKTDRPIRIDLDVKGYDTIFICGYKGVTFYNPIFR